MITGVPAYVDGSMLAVTEDAGARLINGDRMWHYVEGIQNWDPVWPMHGIRILPGPSSVWLDATGHRLPVPLFPGYDTLGTLAHLRATGHDHSWFVLSQQIIEKEFTLSGSEQNPDLTGKDVPLLVKSRLGKGAGGPGAGVHGQRRRLRRARHPRRAHRRDAGAPRRRRARRRARAPRGRGPRSRDRQRLHEGRPDRDAPLGACIPRRSAHPHREPAPHPRSEGRAAHRGQAARPHAQVARRHRDRSRRPRARHRAANPSPGCTPQARRAASAAAACTATARSRARSSADACSRAAPRVGQPPPRSSLRDSSPSHGRPSCPRAPDRAR